MTNNNKLSQYMKTARLFSLIIILLSTLSCSAPMNCLEREIKKTADEILFTEKHLLGDHFFSVIHYRNSSLQGDVLFLIRMRRYRIRRIFQKRCKYASVKIFNNPDTLLSIYNDYDQLFEQTDGNDKEFRASDEGMYIIGPNNGIIIYKYESGQIVDTLDYTSCIDDELAAIFKRLQKLNINEGYSFWENTDCTYKDYKRGELK